MLGPTNHHDYQRRLRNIYEQRFSRRMSFPEYQHKIEIVSDPAVVDKWKEDARKQTSFTTLREEAACIMGSPLSHLLVESYDNRSSITEIRERNPEAKIAIFHGTDDEVIPVRMGRELAREFPFIDFFAVDGANHVGVLYEAHDEIIQWMNN